MDAVGKPRVGLVGLGAMGMGIAVSLVRAGLEVKGSDVRAEAIEAFVAAGGTGVATTAEAAENSDVFVLVVVNAEQAEDVLFGAGAGAAALPRGAVVMLCSTVSPDYARRTAARLHDAGLAMLDSPISGGSVRAAAGELSIMLAGDPTAVARAQAVLDATAAHVHNMGEACGLGSTMKIVNQLLAGVHIAAAAEAIAFGARAGLEPGRIHDVIKTSAGNSWMFENRVPHILADDYTPTSAIDIWVKDLDIVLQTGKDLRLPLFLSAAAHQLYLAASGAGWGRLDDSAVVKVFEKLANFAVLDA